MMKIAYVFSGQGTQHAGMGMSLVNYSQRIKNRFDEAGEIMGESLITIINNHPEILNQTLYAQPAIFTFQSAVVDQLKEEGITSAGACGLSLGEYGALYDAGVFDFENGLRTLIHRAFFMHQSATNQPGKMVALLGDVQKVEALVSTIDGAYIANYNTPVQTVVSGDEKAMDRSIEVASEYGIKRVIPLETSGAFHSPLMAQAAQDFELYVSKLNLAEPNKMLYLNVTGKQYQSNLKQAMVRQIHQPVKFYPMIEAMIEDGFDCFIEIGPKSTLKAMIKKINKHVSVHNIEDKTSLEETLNTIKGVE